MWWSGQQTCSFICDLPSLNLRHKYGCTYSLELLEH